MQGTQVQSPVQEDSTCQGITKQVLHKYRVHVPRVLEWEHLEPDLCSEGSRCNEKPAHWKSGSHSPQLEKALKKQRRPSEVKVAQSRPTLCDPMDYPWNSPGQNPGVGSLSLLQGIFPTQGSNPGLHHGRQILYQLIHQWSPRILEWVAYPFSSSSSRPRNWIGVSCNAGRFFLL